VLKHQTPSPDLIGDGVYVLYGLRLPTLNFIWISLLSLLIGLTFYRNFNFNIAWWRQTNLNAGAQTFPCPVIS